jgi:hypothetical protein
MDSSGEYEPKKIRAMLPEQLTPRIGAGQTKRRTCRECLPATRSRQRKLQRVQQNAKALNSLHRSAAIRQLRVLATSFH